MTVLKELFRRLTIPTLSSTIYTDFLIAIPRIICGALLAFSFGADKFGMPWTDIGSDLPLFTVVDWFPEDIKEYGGVFAIFPKTFAWLGACSEAVGGLFLMFGLQTRISSFFISCTMVVAIVFQKWGGPVWHMLPAMGFLWVGMTSMALGSGRIGLDYLFTNQKFYPSFLKFRNSKSKTIVVIVLFFLAFIQGSTVGQTTGNGILISKTIQTEEIVSLTVGLYAKVTVDASKKGIEITAESNLIDLIDVNYDSGNLVLGQKEWIQPTKRIYITVGTPDIYTIEQETWDTTTVVNLDTDFLKVYADVGTVKLYGKTDNFYLRSKQGEIIADNLEATYADIVLKANAKAIVNVVEEANCDLEAGAVFSFSRKPIRSRGCDKQSGHAERLAQSIEWIDIKIKNNSWGRNHFVVVGPNPKGGFFSYGFPLMPGQIKKERWTTGTKIYKENGVGMRKLLVTITEENRGQLVKLFD